MCGINGIVGMADPAKSGILVQQMNTALAHRGPDDSGVFAEPGIALGHRRLSIIDLSSAGHQPMFTADKRYVIVYNGELYNFKDLRFELQRIVQGSAQTAYPFTTQTDTEVILAAYLRWGKNCVTHFNGMFAFAIWDAQKKELFVARDRMGIKPLYYYLDGKTFLFSSEIRALLSSGLVPRRADPDSLVDYLRYQTVQAPKTILKGVGLLQPGHSAHVSETGVSVEQYWNMTDYAGQRKPEKSYEAVCADVNELLFQAVQRRLVADVPFGAFLSGGIDSSVVVGLMSRAASGKVKTFSVTFDETEFSEARYARIIADKFGTEHHEIRLNIKDFLAELPEALHAMDHPSGDGANTYVVSKATKQAGITMALSGLGGDELFAGYPVFTRSLSLEKKQWLSALPGFVRKATGFGMRTFKPGIASEKISAMLQGDKMDFATTYPFSRQVMMDHDIRKLLNRQVLPENAVRHFVGAFPKLPPHRTLSEVSLAETGTYMQNTLLRDADQMSMSVALEVRVPFLDHTLVEYVLALPDKFKFPHSPKKLLVDAAGDLLPPEIVNRPKMGFTFPWMHWMKNELKSYCEEQIKALGQRSVFHGQAVQDLWLAFLAGDPKVSWSRIWYLVVLEVWLKEQRIEL
jgi:asparagine synthase (glutamine-hydrolysing)